MAAVINEHRRQIAAELNMPEEAISISSTYR
jgi:hypothetical protein